MIQLTCTHCRATLEMDDAFAGGVCRCQHCGTIQTVPSNLKPIATPVASHAGTAQKSLYQSSRANGQITSGLDQLADVVASSGLSQSALRQSNQQYGERDNAGTVSYRTPAKAPPNRTMLLLIAGGVIVLLVAIIGWLAFRSGSPAPAPVNSSSGGSSPESTGTSGTPSVAHPGPNNTNNSITPSNGGGTVTPVSGPSFCGVPLTGQRIVFVLDRSTANRTIFDPLKSSLFKSLRTLGPDKEFAVIFWKSAEDASVKVNAYPRDTLAKATPGNIDKCEKQFEDLTAGGRTKVDEAIREAVARKPSIIILATAKGLQLEDDMVGTVDSALKGQHIPIHTFALGNGNGSKSILGTIADKSGGTYHEIPDADLSR